MALRSVEFALMRQAIGVAQRKPQFVALPPRLQKQMAAILGIGAQKPKRLNKPQANARRGRRIVAPQRLVAVWRCGCVGPPAWEGIVGRSANRVWGGVCAVLCQCLHDAMGGHGMDMVGDAYRGGERRSRERCAKVRGFATLSRHEPNRQSGFYFYYHLCRLCVCGINLKGLRVETRFSNQSLLF